MGGSYDILPVGTELLSSEEEGEIIELDDDDDDDAVRNGDNNAFDDISSDEEWNLRKRIEELEARNLELEKIASISKTTAPNATEYALDYIDLVDGDTTPEVHQSRKPQRHHHQHHHHHQQQQQQHQYQQQQQQQQLQQQRPPKHKHRVADPAPASTKRRRQSADSDRHRDQHQQQQQQQQQRSYQKTCAHRNPKPIHHPAQHQPQEPSHHHHHHQPHHQSHQRPRSLGRAQDTPLLPVSNGLGNGTRHHHETHGRQPRYRPHAISPSFQSNEDARRSTATNNNPRDVRPSRPHHSHHQSHHHQHQPHRNPPQKVQTHRPPPPRLRSPSNSSISSNLSSSSSAASVSSTSSSTSNTSTTSTSSRGHRRSYRRTLRAALKRDKPTATPTAGSSLQRKLAGIQARVTAYIANDVADIVEETEVSASIEIMELLGTLTAENLITDGASVVADAAAAAAKGATTTGEMSVVSVSSGRASVVDGASNHASSHGYRTPPISEAMSLEEHELRLAALKSAILKKHEARKKRKVIEARPYSPTDTDIVLDSLENSRTMPKMLDAMPDENLVSGTSAPASAALESNDDGNEDAQNMEISPVMSPTNSMTTHWMLDADRDGCDKILQPVDMELSDGSTSPEYPMDEDAMDDGDSNEAAAAAMLHSPAQVTDDIRTFEIFQQRSHRDRPLKVAEPTKQIQATPPPPPLDKSVMAAVKQATRRPVTVEDEEEAALRALLLTTKARKPKKVPASGVVAIHVDIEEDPEATEPSVVAEKPANMPVPCAAADATAPVQCDNDNSLDNSADNLRWIAMQTIQTRAPRQATTTSSGRQISNLVAIKTSDYDDVSQKENQQQLPAASQPPASVPTATTVHQKSTATTPSDQYILTDGNRQAAVVVASSHVAPTTASMSASATKTAAAAIKRRAIAMANAHHALVADAKRTRPQSSLITDPRPKTHKPVIVQLSGADDDGESDEWAAASCSVDAAATCNSASLDRWSFDPASPASIAMVDSPGMAAPCSPSAPADAAADDRDESNVIFELKVEDYLRSLRSKNMPSAAIPSTESVKSTPTKAQSTTPPAKKATKMMVTTKGGPATPLVVRHLPLSSQIEYKQLVLRMSMLEQQKKKRTAQLAEKIRQPAAAAQQAPEATAAAPVSLIKTVLVKNVAAQAAQNPSTAAPASTVVVDAVAAEKADIPEPPQPADVKRLEDLEAKYQTSSRELHRALQSQQHQLDHALRVRTRQLLLELQHQRLRQQLDRVGRALAVERDAFKALCPRIVSAHRGMRSERVACVQLARQCRRLGRQCRGVAYTIPDDKQQQIEHDFVHIFAQTKRLKELRTDNLPKDTPKQRRNSEPQPDVVSSSAAAAVRPPVVVVVADGAVVGATCDGGVTPEIVETALPEGAAEPMASRPTDASEPPVTPPEDGPSIPSSTSEDAGNAADRADATNGRQTDAVDRAAAVAAERTGGPASMETKGMPTYQSPLDHIAPQSSTVNPDVVLCPFELQGRCDDRECAYQHLCDRGAAEATNAPAFKAHEAPFRRETL